MESKLYEIPELRQKSGVFRNRTYAGQVLTDMLHAWKDGKALVLAVPSGDLICSIDLS